MSKMKQYRVNGLSFEKEIAGKVLPFGEQIIYLGLNGVLMPCNWRCKYCLEGFPQERTNRGLSLEEQFRLIDDASDLGIRGLLITGGEPLAPKRRKETIALVKKGYEKNLNPLVYTNGSFLDSNLAKELADSGASIALKIDSLVPEKYDKLAGRMGAYDSTMRAIDIVNKTSISKPVAENDSEILVRLLFTTVGNALNMDEYASIARFATQNNARWMLESLNYRGNAPNYHELKLNPKEHTKAANLALFLNPEQGHAIDKQGYCRLFYMVTINTTTGNFGICPQDYDYLGNVREVSLRDASNQILEKVNNPGFINYWKKGICPIKTGHKANNSLNI